VTVTWLDTERRLIEALTYIGADVANIYGEPHVVEEVYDDDLEFLREQQIFNAAELARALEHIK
jgi:hypothetical protein